MGQIKWYKRDPEKALNGMMGLSLDERGAYNTVLDLIYHRDGKLPDDDRFLAGYMGVDVRVWRRIKARLIGLEKLSVIDGMIRDDVADVVVAEALRRLTSARDAGNTSAAKRASKSAPQTQETKDLEATPVEGVDATDASTIEIEKEKEIEGSDDPSLAGAEKKTRKPRAGEKHLMPDDWHPKEFGSGTQSGALMATWSPQDFARHLENFKSHHAARATKFVDWQAAWSTWVINTRSFGNGRSAAPSGNSGDGFTSALHRDLYAHHAQGAAE